ncbi:uncharacterized protein BDZ99DRAFT_514153 [Mytilinidion resinicola]|uniref:Uncharacterized protein n=1 Tax=Mytilinidion resinicola TaxID=574789 RepID=A0A6A6ZA73_9PEZI|nr:uncharacterized protein BDZ99DRAFT_514153 [Mytilinidion resinicola]KAF2817930.1 hypothetical protein BDZ99DRAFT_514153 [Mytilinidion resinicola]
MPSPPRARLTTSVLKLPVDKAGSEGLKGPRLHSYYYQQLRLENLRRHIHCPLRSLYNVSKVRIVCFSICSLPTDPDGYPTDWTQLLPERQHRALSSQDDDNDDHANLNLTALPPIIVRVRTPSTQPRHRPNRFLSGIRSCGSQPIPLPFSTAAKPSISGKYLEHRLAKHRDRIYWPSATASQDASQEPLHSTGAREDAAADNSGGNEAGT